MAELDGKVAIVTGASAPRGIGRAVALRLAAEGASVIVSDIGTAETSGRLDILVNNAGSLAGAANLLETAPMHDPKGALMRG